MLHATTVLKESFFSLAILSRHFSKKIAKGYIYFIKIKPHIKGVVSRDWGRLHMVLLDRYRVLDITAWG
jgi:hypothetical protein